MWFSPLKGFKGHYSCGFQKGFTGHYSCGFHHLKILHVIIHVVFTTKRFYGSLFMWISPLKNFTCHYPCGFHHFKGLSCTKSLFRSESPRELSDLFSGYCSCSFGHWVWVVLFRACFFIIFKIHGNSRKWFGRCRLSCLLHYLSIPLHINSWDDISRTLFVNSPVPDFSIDFFCGMLLWRCTVIIFGTNRRA